MLLWNLGGGGDAYTQVVLTFGALPLVPLLLWRRLPIEQRVWVLLMAAYVGGILWGGALLETRLLILPLVVVVLPLLVSARR